MSDMPRSKKEETGPFTSLRIIGNKAHRMLQHAAQRAKHKPENAPPVPLPEQTEESDIVIRFSLTNIALAMIVVLAVLAARSLILLLADEIIVLLLSFFLAAIIDPGVRMLERWGFPRGIAVLLHYFLAIFVLLFLLVSLIPIIATQLQQIALLINDQVNAFLTRPQISLPLITTDVNQRLTELLQATLQNLQITKFTDVLQTLGQNMSSFNEGLAVARRIAGSVGVFFVELIVVLVLAFFIQIERESIRTWIRSFFSARHRAYIDIKTAAMHEKIGQWARGQLLLGLSIGLLVFVALTLLRMPYAATLAVLAGFTEFIPYVGPFIAAVPSVLIGLTEGGLLWALIIAGVYYVIQWCENNLLVPLIMKRAVGLSPIAVIFAMLIALGFSNVLHPVLGLLLAVPATTIIAIFLDDIRLSKRP